MIATFECYIEEYIDEVGLLGARLRQKLTGKKVDLGFVDAGEKRDFLQFLSAIKQNEALIPDVFSTDGTEDYISISGDLDFEAPDEIRLMPNENLQYLVA